MNINTERYIQHALTLNTGEILLQDQILSQTPNNIIDIHTHLGKPEDAASVDESILSSVASAFLSFTVENHEQMDQKLWINKKVKRVSFGFPLVGINIKSTNEYVQSSQGKNVIPFLTGLPEDLGYTIQEIDSSRWLGIKMYPDQLKPRAKKINEFYPNEVLEAANRKNLALILHLPNNLVEDERELTKISKSYPNLKIILAHFGITTCGINQATEIFSRLSKFSNIFLDTSWYLDQQIMHLGIQKFSSNRIMYGSDQPYSLMRAKLLRLGNGVEFGADYNYHWIENGGGKLIPQNENLPLIHFSSLRSVINAIKKYTINTNLYETVVEKIFYGNAYSLLSLDNLL